MSDGRPPVFFKPDAFDQIAAWMELVWRSKKTRVLFVSHNMGGGCERHIQELSEYLRGDLEILTVRASGKKEAILHFGTRRHGIGLRFKMPGDYGELIKLLKYLGISRVHYHHLMNLHPKIQDLPGDFDIPYDVTLHDYWFINANPTYTNEKGYPTQAPDLSDRISPNASPADTMVAHKWPKSHARFLYQADRVIAPSVYTARLYKRHFPNLMPIIVHHPDREKCGPYPAVRMTTVRPGEFLNVVVLGALNREKGADILEETALWCRDSCFRVKFHLIGYAYRTLDKTVVIHGRYDDSMLKKHIMDLNPHVIWFPALWPETYSYTLSVALESGKPVVAPNIGAFAERLTNRPLTWIRSWKTSGKEWAKFFHTLNETVFKDPKIAVFPWEDQPKTLWNYKQNYHIKPISLQKAADEFMPDKKWIERFVYREVMTSKEKLLLWLLRIRFHPVMDKLLRRVPYHIERRIKRWFSRKPIHEIMQ